jgi:NAD(P)-dependent dehydrogenase (short-subunit alcohol dehydrogenase family)
VNNAGVMALPQLTRTFDGFEMQFATNHLGHFVLATGLRRWLAAAAGPHWRSRAVRPGSRERRAPVEDLRRAHPSVRVTTTVA